MGTLVIQIGQCGNQVGMKLWDQLRANHYSNTDFMFRNGETVAHAILIDTEPKVLKDIKTERLTYAHFDPKNVIFYQHGRGNNWAMGYFNSKNQKRIKQKMETLSKFDKLSILEKANFVQKTKGNSTAFKSSLDKEFSSDELVMRENALILEQTSILVQKEIERCDYYTGSMLIYSLAGGTGSGLGSRILEALRDDYSTNLLYNTAVFPSMSGENPLQQYNCLLSLSHMQNFSDGIVYFQNEKMFKYLSRSDTSIEEKLVNIDDMNDYIASMLTHMFKINDLKTPKNFYFDYLSDLTALNECKFIEMFGAPYTLKGKKSLGPESTWESVFDQTFLQVGYDVESTDTKSMIKEHSAPINSTLALKCILRSPDVDLSYGKNETTRKNLERKIVQSFHPVKWNPDAVSYETIKEKLSNSNDVKTCLIMANRISIASILRELSEVAKAKFKAKAYLHWYYKYGMEEEDFISAFENVDTIIDNYTYLLN
jgi:Tubulin